MFFTKPNLDILPVELLYEIQLFANSEHLPYTCRRIFGVFKAAPNSYKVQYILENLTSSTPPLSIASEYSRILRLSRALRFPLCSLDIFDAIVRITVPQNFENAKDPGEQSSSSGRYSTELPRRLFRSLAPKKSPTGDHFPSSLHWRDRDYPLPFLKKLFANPPYPPFDVNSDDGYALARAVHAKFVPLIEFLLEHGASPHHKNGLPVLVAIRQRDLGLVKLILERGSGTTADGRRLKGKKRKLRDRMDSTPAMLKEAVKCRAWDVVDYFAQEKGVVPDMQTLRMMAQLRTR